MDEDYESNYNIPSQTKSETKEFIKIFSLTREIGKRIQNSNENISQQEIIDFQHNFGKTLKFINMKIFLNF